ncbi:phosphohistidine phosphatase [Fodinibius salinus]|uniref:Phosphohistidine phosphatase n=1 Tax=Fodinibius salinus TaxID=860790 RepID=A0A5D3YK89_9BACT|nr:histidine phosphatase family protein [Fodinibius salinus]TYP93962.1 phosphohistidine phosphatase [Fodinibius salinus]
MKTIMILRHAEAQRGGSASTDKKRKLTAKGRGDATKIGQFLDQQSIAAGYIESSTAKRARETTTLLAESAGLSLNINWNDNFYSGGPADYHQAIRQAPDEVDNILLVGHNPLVSRLVSGLCSSEGQYLVRMLQGTLVCMEHPAISWDQVEPGTARLQWMVTPEILNS